MNIFILEDEVYRFPRNQIIGALYGHSMSVATSVDIAKRLYNPGSYDLLLLDHDMHGFYESSDVPNCGYQFVLWLINQESTLLDRKKPKVILHSQNATGRKNMFVTLEKAGYTCAEFAFSQKYVEWLIQIAKGE